MAVSISELSGSDYGLSPAWPQTIIEVTTDIVSIKAISTNFKQILTKIQQFSFKKMHFKLLYENFQPFLSQDTKS